MNHGVSNENYNNPVDPWSFHDQHLNWNIPWTSSTNLPMSKCSGFAKITCDILGSNRWVWVMGGGLFQYWVIVVHDDWMIWGVPPWLRKPSYIYIHINTHIQYLYIHIYVYIYIYTYDTSMERSATLGFNYQWSIAAERYWGCSDFQSLSNTDLTLQHKVNN